MRKFLITFPFFKKFFYKKFSGRHFLAGDVEIKLEGKRLTRLLAGTSLPLIWKHSLNAKNSPLILEMEQARIPGLETQRLYKVPAEEGMPVNISFSILESGVFVMEFEGEGLAKKQSYPGKLDVCALSGLLRLPRENPDGLVTRGFAAVSRLFEEKLRASENHETLCAFCKKQFSFSWMNSFATEEDYYYCNRCPNVLVFQKFDPVYFHHFKDAALRRIHAQDNPSVFTEEEIEENFLLFKKVENHLAPCPCGGNFTFFSPAKCPRCRSPFVDFKENIFWRIQEAPYIVAEGADVITPATHKVWTDDFLKPFSKCLRIKRFKKNENMLGVFFRLQNKEGWFSAPVEHLFTLVSKTHETLAPVTPSALGENQKKQIRAAFGEACFSGSVGEEETGEGLVVFELDKDPKGPVVEDFARGVFQQYPGKEKCFVPESLCFGEALWSQVRNVNKNTVS